MRKIALSTLFIMAIAISSFAQTWQKFNYQGVARNAQGEVIENQAVGIRISLHVGTASGTVVYKETHAATTNEFGLFDLAIGGGTVVSGTFGTIDWGNNDYYVQVEMDPAGGTAYADMGTSQLLSVPYAMYAANAGVPGVAGPTGPTGATGATGAMGSVGPAGPEGPLVAGTVGQTLRHNGTSWEASSLLYNSGTNIGIGTSSPGRKIQVSNTSSSSTYLLMNNGATGNGSSDGMSIGVEADGGAHLWQWESNYMKFGTSNIERMRINAAGLVGVGTTVPDVDARLSVAESTLESALLLGAGDGALAYFTVNQPAALTTNIGGIARFREDGLSRVIVDDAAASYQLTVYGDGYASGGTWVASDKNLKRNISTISSAMGNLMKLNPTSYYFENESESAKILNLPEELQFGLLAQDVKEVFPNLVKETVLRDEDGKVVNSSLHGMNYTGLIPVLIKALQEHQELIESLQAEIELLKNK